jgi:hypothetical protein
VSTGSGYLPHAIARFAESNPFSLEAARGRSVHVGLRQINFFQKQKKLNIFFKKYPGKKAKKVILKLIGKLCGGVGGERHEREGCGLKIKHTSILLPSNLVVLVGTFLCQIRRLSFFFSFWVESADRNEITHRPRILRDQITIWQVEAKRDRGKTRQGTTSKASERGT